MFNSLMPSRSSEGKGCNEIQIKVTKSIQHNKNNKQLLRSLLLLSFPQGASLHLEGPLMWTQE